MNAPFKTEEEVWRALMSGKTVQHIKRQETLSFYTARPCYARQPDGRCARTQFSFKTPCEYRLVGEDDKLLDTTVKGLHWVDKEMPISRNNIRGLLGAFKDGSCLDDEGVVRPFYARFSRSDSVAQTYAERVFMKTRDDS